MWLLLLLLIYRILNVVFRYIVCNILVCNSCVPISESMNEMHADLYSIRPRKRCEERQKGERESEQARENVCVLKNLLHSNDWAIKVVLREVFYGLASVINKFICLHITRFGSLKGSTFCFAFVAPSSSSISLFRIFRACFMAKYIYKLWSWIIHVSKWNWL